MPGVNWWGVSGALVQIFGTGMAAWALRDNLRTYGDGRGVIPPLATAWSWVRLKLRRRRAQTVIPGTAASVGAAAASGSITLSGTAYGHAPVPDDMPVPDLLRVFGDRMSTLVAEESRRADAALQQKFAEFLAQSDETSNEIRRQIAEVAAGRARQELLGLFLVIIGTVIAAIG